MTSDFEACLRGAWPSHSLGTPNASHVGLHFPIYIPLDPRTPSSCGIHSCNPVNVPQIVISPEQDRAYLFVLQAMYPSTATVKSAPRMQEQFFHRCDALLSRISREVATLIHDRWHLLTVFMVLKRPRRQAVEQVLLAEQCMCWSLLAAARTDSQHVSNEGSCILCLPSVVEASPST